MGTTVTVNYGFIKPNPFEETDLWGAELNTNWTSLDTLLKATNDAVALRAPIASPTFTGVPAAPTAAPGTNTTQISTTAFVKAAIDVVLGGVGAAFDTLSEIATAIGLLAPIASPTFTGDPKAPTPAPGDNDTSIATTAFVAALGALKADLAGPTFTGDPKAPTPAPGDNDTSISTTAFVTAAIATAIAAVTNPWTSVFKTADEARNNTVVLTADSALTFAMVAGTYVIRGSIWAAVGASATPDFKYSITGASGTGYFTRMEAIGAGSANWSNSVQISASTTYNPSTTLDGGASGNFRVDFEINVVVGGSGTFAFNWAQNNSDAVFTTVKAGSYLEYRKVA